MKNYITKKTIIILGLAFLLLGGNVFAKNLAPLSCSITSFNANQTTIYLGQSSTLSWSTNDCVLANISPNVGNVNTTGTQAVYPTSTTTYTLTAYGANGTSVTQSLIINVLPQACSISSFNAYPTSISPGQSSTLSWSTNDCVSASISPNVGNVNTTGTQAVYPMTTTTYTLTAYGANGTSVTQSLTIAVQQSACSIVNFNAIPSVINLGQFSTLSWATNNCTSVTISNLNYLVPTSGSQDVYPTATTTYVLTAYGVNGSTVTQSKTVTVTQQNCSIVNFNANPNTITSGQSSTLTWVTNNCTSVSISNIGSVSVNGSQTVSPIITTTYVLTATGSSGIPLTQSQTVTVNQVQNNCSISSFLANPTSINSGGSSTLTWATNNCTSVTISNLGYNVPTSGTQVIYPTQTTTYLLTAYDANGTSVTQSQTVTVNQIQNCSISSFSANPTYLNSSGSSTLTWATSNCTSVNISNIGSVSVSGSQVVYPTVTTTYVLTAYGGSGASVTQSVTVTVNQVQNCSISYFSASPTYLNSSGSSTLSWATNNCTSVTISNLGYNVPTSGTQVIYPTYTTSYTLTAYGSNGTPVTQSVTITVNNQFQNCSITNFTVNGSSSATVQSGSAVNLYWNTTGNCSVNISGPNFNSSNASGSQTIYPTYSGTYTLVAYGSGSGNQTQSVYVNVNSNQYNNCTISSFSASPTSINYGGLSTLSWSTSNCSSVSITNLGNVNNYGSQTVYPTSTTNYIINAYGSNGGIPVTQTIQIYVNNYVPPPTPIYNTCAVTGVATNITKNSVTLNGLITNNLNSYGANTYFEYGTTVDLGRQTNPRSASGNTTFSETLTGLSTNTIYFYRLVSNCNNNISRGAIEIFQTSGSATTTTIINQGTTIIGTESPIMLRIENRYQSFRVGDSVDYTVTYKNISNKTLTRPILQVIIPKGITFLNSSRGTYSNNTYTLTVSLEDLTPNLEGVVYVQGRVDSIDSGNAQIVTTALLVYTNKNGAQENAMAYVLNNPMGNNSLTAAAFFSGFWGLGVIGWLLVLIIILLLILLFRKYLYRRPFNTTTTTHTDTHEQY